jgi:hypothetical protein
VPWRDWELNLITVNIKDGPTPTAHSVVMVLGCAVNAQTVPRATHAAAQASTDEDIKGLIDRRK